MVSREKFQTTKAGNQTWSITECFKKLTIDIPKANGLKKKLENEFLKVSDSDIKI